MPTSTRPSIRVVKQFAYKGALKNWSSRYYFTGPVPADSAHWTTLSDAIVTAEKATMLASGTIIASYGYAAGSDVPVFSKTYTTAGTKAIVGIPQTGDVTALVRYSTATRTAKNHPLYLYNYYHGVEALNNSNPDVLETGRKTAYQTYAGLWVAGFSDGTNVQVRCGPQGSPATGYTVATYVTHRDFPRG